MRTLRALVCGLLPQRVYPCQVCGRPMPSPEERLLHAVYTECGQRVES